MQILVYQAPVRGEGAEGFFTVRGFAFGLSSKLTPAGGAELALVDARRMSLAAIKQVLAQLGSLKQRGGVRRVVMLCPKPTLEVAVAAIRAGVSDIVPFAPGALGLLRLLRAALPADTRSRARLRALIAAGRSLLRSESPARRAAVAAEFSPEHAELARRRDALAREEARIEGLRSALAMREAQLARQERRVEEALGSLHESRGEMGFGLREELEAKAKELEQRARALELRERMLSEWEGLLEDSSRSPFATASARS